MPIVNMPPPQRPAIAYTLDRQQFALSQEKTGIDFDRRKGEATASLLANRLDPLVLTLRSIGEITLDISDDEEDFAPPTQFARDHALLLVLEARAKMQDIPFPRGVPSATGTGGVRIEWQYRGSSVRLVIPGKPDGLTYIYYEYPEGYGRHPTVTAQILADSLEQLVRE